MTDLEALAVQFRDAEKRWQRAFMRQHSAKDEEAAARMLLVRARLELDAEIEKRIGASPESVVDALLERAFRAA